MVTNRHASPPCYPSWSVSLNLSRTSIAAILFLAGKAEPAPAIHYAPAENLEHIDVVLIDRAEHEIDMAAYVLTDWPVMQALTRAAGHGGAIRTYLDGTQLAEREPAKIFNYLAETPGVEIRIKHNTSAPMQTDSTLTAPGPESRLIIICCLKLLARDRSSP